MKIGKAFSLIELMIVVAIIGILSAVSVPAYKNYIIRSKIVEAVQIGDHIGKAITDYYTVNGSWPTTLAAINLTSTSYSASQYITSIALASNTYGPLVTINLTASAVGLTSPANNIYLGFKQSAGSEIIKSQCGQYSLAYASAVPLQYLPTGCNDTGVYAFVTTP